MNFVKPTVRVALIRQTKVDKYIGSFIIAPDHWEATAYLSTAEGQGTNKSFVSMKKEDALGNAYRFLKLCMKHDTLFLDTAERKEAESNKSPEEKQHELRALKANEDLMCNRITYTHYLTLEKLGFPESVYIEVPPEPGPKWSFWNWFK